MANMIYKIHDFNDEFVAYCSNVGATEALCKNLAAYRSGNPAYADGILADAEEALFDISANEGQCYVCDGGWLCTNERPEKYDFLITAHAICSTFDEGEAEAKLIAEMDGLKTEADEVNDEEAGECEDE